MPRSQKQTKNNNNNNKKKQQQQSLDYLLYVHISKR